VPDRIDVRDAGQVADERARRAPPARAPDAYRADIVDDVGDREEVRRVPELVDHVELVIQPLGHRVRPLHAAALDAAPAPLGEHRRRRAAGGRGKFREVHPSQAEVERAHLVDLQSGIAEIRPLDEQPSHVARRLEPSLGVRPRDVVPVDRDELAHALERVREERVVRHQVPDGVRRDRARRGPLGEAKQRADLVVRSRLEPLLHPDEQPLGERLLERRDRVRGRRGPPRDRERADRRRGPQHPDEAVRVRADLLDGERRLPPLPEHVRVGDQPAEVRVSHIVDGEDDDRRIPDGERRSEDRADADLLRRVHEPRRAVQRVTVGERHRAESKRRRACRQVLRGEGPVLQREEGADVQVDERSGGIEHVFDSRITLRRLSRNETDVDTSSSPRCAAVASGRIDIAPS
jgi:hypothetical protein